MLRKIITAKGYLCPFEVVFVGERIKIYPNKNFEIVLNGEYDDGCGILLYLERRDALWSVAIVGYYCRVIMIVIVLHIV